MAAAGGQSNEEAPASGVARFALMGVVTSGVGVVLNIVRSKLIAVYVGPVGVGIVAEVTQLLTLVGVIATVANSPALLKWISESVRAGDPARLSRGLGTSLVMAGGLGGLATLACIAAGPWLLGGDWPVDLRLAIALSGVSVTLTALAGCLNAVHVGYSDARAIGLSSVIGAALSTVALAVGVWWAGLNGQFVALAIGSLAMVAVTAVFVLRRPSVRIWPAWDADFAWQAVTIGASSLVAGYIAQGLLSAIRVLLEREGHGQLGTELNGNFQAAYAIGTTYFSAVLQGIGQYYFPRYASARDADELTAEVHAAAGFVLRVTPPLVFLAITLREPLIAVMYDSRFTLAGQMLGYMLATDILKAVSWSYAGPLPMRGQVRAFLLTESVALVVGVPMVAAAIHWLGPSAIGLGLLASTVVYLGVAAAVVSRACGVTVAPWHLATAAGLSVSAAAYAWMISLYPAVRWVGLVGILAGAWWFGAIAAAMAWITPRVQKLRAILGR